MQVFGILPSEFLCYGDTNVAISERVTEEDCRSTVISKLSSFRYTNLQYPAAVYRHSCSIKHLFFFGCLILRQFQCPNIVFPLSFFLPSVEKKKEKKGNKKCKQLVNCRGTSFRMFCRLSYCLGCHLISVICQVLAVSFFYVSEIFKEEKRNSNGSLQKTQLKTSRNKRFFLLFLLQTPSSILLVFTLAASLFKLSENIFILSLIKPNIFSFSI